jgi:large subunit ribosomal protein L23
MDNFQVIKQPIITERSTDLKEKRQLVFKVDMRANKREIKRAVEALFDTKVQRVNTARVAGKPKSLGRYVGRRANWKKAIVTIKEGAKLDIFGE